MRQTLAPLTTRRFDLLVVGGGVYGLTIACDAAQRGLQVALVERRDFGSGTSFNHLRTIHGGLRYLQTLDITRARESVRERRTLATIAPWAVVPQTFVLPLQRSLTRGAATMRAGFLLDRLVSHDRNQGLPPSHRLPPGRVVGPSTAQRQFGLLNGLSFTGAAVWTDYVAVEADRLTLAWALAAERHGAAIANYVEVDSLVRSGTAVVGVHASDTETGERFEIQAALVVNATGGSLNRLLRAAGTTVELPLLRAMNLVTSLPAPDYALGGRSASGRNLFMVPWRGQALFGTWESAAAISDDALDPPDEEIDAFLTELRQAFPAFALSRDSVTLIHRGAVPARLLEPGRLALDGREHVYDHAARDGIQGLISVAGTKYTTARAIAERVVDLAYDKLSRPRPPCRTTTTSLASPALDLEERLRDAPREHVVHLDDAVVRRTTLGALGRPTPQVLAHAAGVVAEALGWRDEQRLEELARFERVYRPLAQGTEKARKT